EAQERIQSTLARFGFHIVRLFQSNKSALRELEAPASAALAIFLAFLHSAVAGQEPGAAKGDLQRTVIFRQGPAQAHDDRAGLAGGTTTGAAGEDVEFATGVGDLQRAEDALAIALAGQVFVERPAVEFDLAAAGGDAHAGDSTLAPADAPCIRAIGLGLGSL